MRARGRVNTTIQGLRGLAAVAVVLFHLYMWGGKFGLLTLAEPDVQNWLVPVGRFSVSVFFMISGYLIVQTLVKHGRVSVFFRNRILRIYPLFLMLHLVVFAIGWKLGIDGVPSPMGQPLAWGKQFLYNALFLPGMFPGEPVQTVAWSLSYEAFFYVAAAGLYLGLAQKKILWGLLGAAIAVWSLTTHWLCWFFVAGTLAWWLEKEGKSLRVPGPVGLLALAGAYAAFDHLRPLSPVLAFVFFASAVSQTGWMSALLRQQPWQWLGRVSYSLYLVHPFVIDLTRRVAQKVGGLPVHIVLGLAGSFLVAELSFRLIEERLTRWLQTRWTGRPAPEGAIADPDKAPAQGAI